ncbi:MAG: hypothetical protein KY445_11605, partial [Armatimonadetes bacterium]|nr:hypothetical protein [Armatimonadota bacterium]
MKKWLQILSRYGAAFLGFAAVLYFCAWMFRPRLATTPIARSAQEAKSVEKLRDVSFDPKNPPVVQREVDYSLGKAAP